MADTIIITNKSDIKEFIRDSLTEIFQEQVANEAKPRIDLLSLHEAADYLQLAPQTLYGFTSGRKIPFLKKGKKLYFKLSELEKWLETGRKKTTGEIEDELKKK